MFLASNLILAKKQKFGKCNSIEYRNGRNKTNKYLKSNLLLLQWANWFKRFWCKVVNYIGYVTIKKIGDYNNSNSVNPLYLMIKETIGHFECNSIECNSVECNSIECNSLEEKNKNKYLVLDEIDENKEVLDKYEEVW